MADDPHLYVEFFADAVHSKRLSVEAGRPIFEDREFVRIRWVGDNKRELVAPAHELFQQRERNGEHVTYAEKFPDQYAVFKDRGAKRKKGTPLEMLPFLKPTQVAAMEYSHIFTAEDLAGLSGGAARNLGPEARDIIDQTKAWLEQAKDAAAAMKLSGENEDLKARIARLEAKLDKAEAKAEPATSGGPEHDDDGPVEIWSDEKLRAVLTEAGAAPRANAARAGMIAAIKDMQATE